MEKRDREKYSDLHVPSAELPPTHDEREKTTIRGGEKIFLKKPTVVATKAILWPAFRLGNSGTTMSRAGCDCRPYT